MIVVNKEVYERKIKEKFYVALEECWWRVKRLSIITRMSASPLNLDKAKSLCCTFKLLLYKMDIMCDI